MIEPFRLLFIAISISRLNIAFGKPLDPEAVESLLPPTPQTKNETLAAVVQDPVVQDAVQQTASNGSLNGLVVKKRVYILPANDPNTVLTKREHILVVPTENLEDVRKNITETKMAEGSTESSSMVNELFVEGETDDYMPQSDATSEIQGIESLSNRDTASFVEPDVEEVPVNEDHKIEPEVLADKLNQHTPGPELDSKKLSVPIVAVIDPSNATNGKVNAPIVAILPNKLSNDALTNHVAILKNNSETIQRKVQNYVDESSVSVNPDYWREPTIGSEMIPTTKQQVIPELSDFTNAELVFAPVALYPDHPEYPRSAEDMDVAEDIIFRPLFRYRQEERSNRRYYNSYRRRGYYYNQYNDY